MITLIAILAYLLKGDDKFNQEILAQHIININMLEKIIKIRILSNLFLIKFSSWIFKKILLFIDYG